LINKMAKPIKFRSLKNSLVEHVDKEGYVYWIVTDLRNKKRSKR